MASTSPIVLTDNEFFSGLTNLALFIRLYATNTSSAPDAFVDSFLSDTLSAGNTKIFPWSDLGEVEDYKPTSTLLEIKKVKAGEEYLQITEQKVIRSSYNRYILDMAFTSEAGMNEFIGYILGQMDSTKTDYLYDEIITDLFSKVFTGAKQNQAVDQYDLSTVNSFTELNNGYLVNNKEITNDVQQVLQNIQYFTRDYNGLKNKEALRVGDLKFIFCEPYKSKNLINLYAELLNSQVITNSFAKPELYTVPQIKVPTGKEGVIGWILHKSAYQLFYKFVFRGEFFDVSNLTINNFLHFWYGKGWLENLPAVKFTANKKTLGA